MDNCCSICVEPYTKTLRKGIPCPYCDFVACRVCVQKFQTENTIEPKCMACNTRWPMEFFRDSMTKSFMDKDYRRFQTQVIQTEAEAQLPLLQDLAKTQEQEERIYREIQAIRNHIKEEKRRIQMLERELMHGSVTVPILTTERKHTFPCGKPTCHGHMDEKYKCVMCEQQYCRHCLKDLSDDHVCVDSDVETVRILQQNTRACPKCRTGIYKTEGCDQMWCVMCHTCFSWKTGNIMNGTVHNPHYYEFMRTQRQENGGVVQRNLGDIPCGGMPTLWQVRDVVDAADPEKNTVFHLHRLMNHIIAVFMPRIHRKSTTKQTRFQTWGVRFLRQQIDKTKWLTMLYRASKEEEVYRSHYQLLEALSFNGSEIFRQLCVKSIDVPTFLQSMESLFRCYNEGIDQLNRYYKTKHRHLSIHTATTDVR